MKFSLFIILVLGLIASCRDYPDPYTVPGIEDCHKMNNPDSSSLAQAMIGKWKWHFIICGGLTNGDYTSDDSVEVEFKSNGTFFIREYDVLTDSSTWHLRDFGNDTYWLENTISGWYFGGRIFLCEDDLLFKERDSDICDNYFRRIE